MIQIENSLMEKRTKGSLEAARAPGRLSLHWMREYAVVVTVVILFIALLASSPSFRTGANMANILSQSAIIGIMALGVGAVFIAGEFDLSIGAIYTVAALVGASSVERFGGIGGILVGVAAGAAMGLVNGLLVSIGRINAFMATLASSFLIGGLGVLLTKGTPVVVTDQHFLDAGQAQLFGLQFPVFVWLGVFAILAVLLQFTKFGRRLYATGGNKDAARLSGVNVPLVKTLAFIISGSAAGLAGTIAASQVGSADPNAGMTLVLTPIAAVVVGGISIYGGEGGVWRSVAGVFLLVLINNGFNLLGIDALYAQVVQGAVILFAVAVDAWSGKTRN